MIELNEQNFESAVKSGITVIDFYADWCNPCKIVLRNIDAIKSEYDIMFTKVNADRSGSILGKFEIRGIPTVVIMKDGKEVKRFSGVKTQIELREIFDEVLGV